MLITDPDYAVVQCSLERNFAGAKVTFNSSDALLVDYSDKALNMYF